MFMRTVLLAAAVALLAQGPLHAAPDQGRRIAVIDTEAFGDAKTGVRRLANALDAVDAEFKPRSVELQQAAARYEQLIKDANAAKAKGDQKAFDAKAAQAAAMRNDLERRQENARREMAKRMNDVTGPVNADISRALKAYARQRGFDVVFDLSKTHGAMMVANDEVNITAAFIAEYNRSTPAK